MGKVVRLPKVSAAKRAQAMEVQEIVDSLPLSKETHAEISNALYKRIHEPGKQMITWMLPLDSPLMKKS